MALSPHDEAARTVPAGTPVVSVCIATHKRPRGPHKFLTSLTEQDPFGVLVVDNAPGVKIKEYGAHR